VISAPVLTQKFKSGSYKINYRVVSDDGHPVIGNVNFKLA